MSEIYEDLLKLKTNGESGVLVTVVNKEGHGPAVVGTKMLVRTEGQKSGTVGGGALEHAAVKRALNVMAQQKGELQTYYLGADNELLDPGADIELTGMMCGGSVTLFFEYFGSGAHLYIFGAGHIGKALAYHLRHLDYYITIVDSREGMVEAVEGVQRRITASYRSVLQDQTVRPGSYFIIVTHSHALDYVILKRIYEAGWQSPYIGLIASKRKAPVMVEQLKQEMGTEVNLDNLYSPIGLRTGGTLPHDIAVSIAAELQAVRYGKTGNNHMKLDFNPALAETQPDDAQ